MWIIFEDEQVVSRRTGIFYMYNFKEKNISKFWKNPWNSLNFVFLKVSHPTVCMYIYLTFQWTMISYMSQKEPAVHY